MNALPKMSSNYHLQSVRMKTLSSFCFAWDIFSKSIHIVYYHDTHMLILIRVPTHIVACHKDISKISLDKAMSNIAPSSMSPWKLDDDHTESMNIKNIICNFNTQIQVYN